MKTLTFNKDNWSGEDGTVTYDPDKPLHFQVDTMPTRFWLEPAPWDGLENLSPEDREDILDSLGDRYHLKGDDWPEDYILGTITQDKPTTDKPQTCGTAVGYERDAYDSCQKFTPAEKLLVTAARLIFMTV